MKYTPLTPVLLLAFILFSLISCEKERVPTVTTARVTFISEATALGGGEVTAAGSDRVAVRGVCWSTSPNPTIQDAHSSDSSGTGSYLSTLTGLTEDHIYYVRAYATSEAGTAYGQEMIFDNSWGESGTFTDPREGGTEYRWVRIADQIWMAENLAYLPRVSASDEYLGNDPYYYVYGYEGNSLAEARATENFTTYGVLYNWPASMGACPDGWHLPSDDEWKVLKGNVDSQYGVGDPEWDQTRYQGYDAGANLKSKSGWNYNGNGTDLYGFAGLPGGYRQYDTGFFLEGDYGYWWASTLTGTFGWCHYLSWGTAEANREYYMQVYGYSVRCIRD
ncbi:MAG: hypothetical protein LC649_02725 [Bacteroidales bacterium]|nr:hypothetical protein [Bacteroidales bacterium]